MNDAKTGDDSGNREVLTNPDCIPTKELMKRQRKAEYLKAKAMRKAERVAEKDEKAAAKAKARSERDAALWSAMKTAKDLGDTE